MGVPRVTSIPDYGPDSASKFIPEVWSGKLVEKFYKATVFGEIASPAWVRTSSSAPCRM
jgi:hypothetical protein